MYQHDDELSLKNLSKSKGEIPDDKFEVPFSEYEKNRSYVLKHMPFKIPNVRIEIDEDLRAPIGCIVWITYSWINKEGFKNHSSAVVNMNQKNDIFKGQFNKNILCVQIYSDNRNKNSDIKFDFCDRK